MPASSDPLALALTWGALLLATSLYGLLVRRRAVERRQLASQTRDVGRAFVAGLTRVDMPGADRPAGGAPTLAGDLSGGAGADPARD